MPARRQGTPPYRRRTSIDGLQDELWELIAIAGRETNLKKYALAQVSRSVGDKEAYWQIQLKRWKDVVRSRDKKALTGAIAQLRDYQRCGDRMPSH